MEKRARSFMGGAAILMVVGLIVKFIGAVYRIPMNNIVGPDGMGYYDVVYKYYQVLVVVSTSGFPTAISKMVSERVSLGDYHGAREVFRSSLRLLLLLGVAFTLFMFFGAEPLSRVTYGADAAVEEIQKQALSFRALSPALFFVALLCAYRGYLQGLQRMGGTAASQLVEQLGKLGIGLTLAYLLKPKGVEYAAMGALIGISACELLGLLSILPFYRRYNKGVVERIRRQNKKEEGKQPVTGKLLAIAVPVTIGAAIMPLTNLIDTALIIRTLRDIGYTEATARESYSLLASYVYPIINMPAVLTVALAMSLVPAMSSFMARKDAKNVRNITRTGMKLSLIIGAPCAVGLFVLAEPIVNMLYGSNLSVQQVSVAAGLMQTSCVGVLFLSLVQTATAMIQGLNKPVAPVLNLAFGGILKIITMLILVRIPHINVQGAAVSTVVCYASACILDVVFLIRRTRTKVHVWDVFGKPVAASLLMGVAVYFLYAWLNGLELNIYISTLGAVLVGVLLYGAAFVLLKMLNAEDLQFIPGGGKLQRLFVKK